MRNLYIIKELALYICTLPKRRTVVINERLTKMEENQEESVCLTEDMRL